MLRNKKIAAFIDVDNAVLEMTNYENVLSQLEEMGEIVCATVYGASDKKHKKIIEHAMDNGFALQFPSRTRRRVKKVFDNRIWVDVATVVAQNRNIDAVAIVSAPDDMTYLYGNLRRLGISVIACDNCDENSMALVDATLDLGKVEKIKLPKNAPKKAAPAPKKAAEPKKTAEASAEDDKTAQLLREIEKLQQSYEKPAEEPVKPAREPARVENEPAANETKDLLDKIAALQNDEPKEEPAKEPEDNVRTVYVSQNDSDLIRKIEELRLNNSGSDSDELVAQIKKLLDGVE
ncbi:MAG: NYN domain-containing protein [Corallococcus sp.]|nr:NYN domain-containing protein [Corallococcus sp.]MCM1359779.1 NYN domain-containing protein [Corallococcus sp.]MCM1395695.1 NYN domain-containing protein [Corallococcus sp.]